MTDKKALEIAISNAKLTKTHIAAELDISREALRQKSKNIRQFKAGEIDALANLLNLSAAERNAIFFAH